MLGHFHVVTGGLIDHWTTDRPEVNILTLCSSNNSLILYLNLKVTLKHHKFTTMGSFLFIMPRFFHDINQDKPDIYWIMCALFILTIICSQGQFMYLKMSKMYKIQQFE